MAVGEVVGAEILAYASLKNGPIIVAYTVIVDTAGRPTCNKWCSIVITRKQGLLHGRTACTRARNQLNL